MQTIIVDMTPGFRMPTIYYSQGDVGTQFAIDLRSRFGDSFPTGTTVTIQATKPSGFGFSVAATSVTNGVATFTTTAEMTDEFGRFPAELKVTKTGLTLFSANFYMDGEENTHPDGTIDGQQETVIPELAQLVERVEDAASSVLDMTVVANTLPAGSDATYSYDEETNTATFGIPKGADGSLASGVLAPTYSSSSTYAVGDYVYYSGSLYRCTTAITTAEAWTSGHWTQVALAPEVSDLKSDLNFTENDIENVLDYIWDGSAQFNNFVQGDRDSNNPSVISSSAFRCTLADGITFRRGDTFSLVIPNTLKAGIVTSTGYSSGFRTNTTYTPNLGSLAQKLDVYVTVAKADTTQAITPSDIVGLTITHTDGTSIIKQLENATISATASLLSYENAGVTIAGYTVNDGRIYSSSSDTKRSDYIAVKSGTKIAYRLCTVEAINVLSFYTDKTATNASAPSYVSGVAGLGSGTYSEGVYTAPQDGYIVFSNANAYTDVYIGCVGGLYSVEKSIDTIENELGVADLTGKYILNFGDSLGHGYGNSNKSYAYMIAQETGATLADYSVSGTPYANYGLTDSYACVCNQVKSAISDHSTDDVAICFVEGGINDLKRNVLDIGTLTDNYDGTYAQNMIIGATEDMFYRLKNAFPSAKIVFVMYHKMPLSTTTPSLSYTDMYARQETEHAGLKSACEKWSVPMADVYAEGTLNSNIQSMAETYFGVDVGEKFGRDIAHPNALGYRKFYVPLIKQILAKMTFEEPA